MAAHKQIHSSSFRVTGYAKRSDLEKKGNEKKEKMEIKKRSLENQTVIKTAVQLSGLSFPEDVHGVAKACRCGEEPQNKEHAA